MNHVEVIIIGGGQAGLAMGYLLKRKGVTFFILDAHKRTGDSWRSRYDSLTLFTPRMYSSLPGMKFPGVPEGLPAKDETADYLEAYAKAFALPIRHQTNVYSLTKHEFGFKIETGQETFTARQVLVATGPFQEPVIPDFAKNCRKKSFSCILPAIKMNHSLRTVPYWWSAAAIRVRKSRLSFRIAGQLRSR